MKKIFKKFMALILAFSFVTSSIANVNDEMRKTFNSMTNYTRPGAYEGQSRGVITGGNLYLRDKITKQNLFSFKAPSLSAGCGGVDFFGGSFGFIDASQFEAMIQGIAANARGYAIGLALDIVCPTCAANMKELQKRMQDLSSKMSSSCEMAKNLVNVGDLDEKASKARERSSEVSTLFAKYDNYWKSKPESRTGGGPTNPVSTLSDDELKAAKLIGNITWAALGKNDVAGWYTSVVGSKRQLRQIMMSLAGTVIMKKGLAQGSTTEAAFEPDARSGILEMNDFLNGNPKAIVFKCVESWSDDGCLTLGTEEIAITGMLTYVNNMLMGDGTERGIIAKLKDRGNTKTFSAAEEAFITAASPGILGVLRDFAHDTRSAAAISDVFAITIAQEMTIGFMVEMMQNLQSAVASTEDIGNLKAEVNRIMGDSTRKIREQRISNGYTLAGMSSAFQIASYVRSTLKQSIDSKRDPVVGK